MFKRNLVLLLLLLSFNAFSQKKKQKEIEKIALEWAQANNSHSIERLKSLYASSVMFYGISKSLSTCLQEKKIFFDKYNDYSISISDLDIDSYKSGFIKCSFVKHEAWDGKARNPQQGYLLFESIEGKYAITVESDHKMDTQRGYTQKLGVKVNSSNNILFLIIGIVLGILFYTIFILRKRKRKVAAFSKQNIAKNISSTKESGTIVKEIPVSQFHEVSNELTNKQDNISITEQDKGYEFEKWVIAKFPKLYYEVQEWRSDKYHKGHYAKSSMLPDFEIIYRHKNRRVVFAVECKWRNEFHNGKIVWTKIEQLERYKEYESASSKSVFVVIGIGGKPDNPQSLYIIPLRKINSTELSLYELKGHSKSTDKDFFFNSYNNILS